MRLSLVGPLPPLRGGIAHFTSLLVEGLSREHQVQTVSFERLYPALLYPGRSEKEPGANDKRVVADVLLHSLNPLSWIRAVRAIRSHNPQLVILQWWTSFLAPVLYIVASFLKRKQKPITFIIHNVLPHEARSLDRFLAKRVLSKGNSFIFLNEMEKEKFLRLLPRTERVEVCTHPHLEIFDPGEVAQQAARKALDLPEDKAILLFFGFVRPYKGLEVLLRSLPGLRLRSEHAFLLVAGEIWGDKSRYLEVITETEIGDIVRLDDRYIEDGDVGLYFRAADVFVAPHLRGSQSGVLRTALRLGVPSVATEQIADAIPKPHPRHLLVVPPGDVKALQNGMVEALKLVGSVAPQPDLGRDDLTQLIRTLVEFAGM
jgi:glycosyltransferase involved in cell wall biosynthesis